MHRRGFNIGLLSAAFAGGFGAPALAQTAPAAQRGLKLVTVGTKAGPRVGGARANPCNLLLIDGTPFVIDCGYGAARGIVDSGVALPSVRYVFISHHHSDHNLDFGNIVNAAWSAGLNAEIKAFGPKGLKDMTSAYWELNKLDVATRIEDEGKPDVRKLLAATDIDEGVILETPAVKVTAMRTPHPPIAENFAFKFDTAYGTVVFSGDTAFNPKLAEFARGCDILVHEALFEPGIDRMVARVPFAATLKKHLMDSHTTTDDVGRIAAMAQPKLLVLSHIVPGDDVSITDALWLEGVRRHYSGDAVVAKDRMAFVLPPR